MKKRTLLIIFAFLFFIIITAGEVFAGADNLCPLPKEYKVKLESGGATNGEKDLADPGCRVGESLSKATTGEPKNGSTNASFVVDENANTKWSFRAHPGGVLPKDITGNDQTTSDWKKWEPLSSVYHKITDDMSPKCNKNMSTTATCYTYQGIEKHKWDGTHTWKVNKLFHVYHMDSPTKYGVGQIGYHVGKGESIDDNGGTNEGLGVFDFSYRVPSVPVWYAASSAITITWDWDSTKVEHEWKAHHVPCMNTSCPMCKCILCGHQPWSDCQDENSQNPLYQKPEDQVSCTKWYPDKFWSSQGITEPDAAKSRVQGSKYFDEQGIASSVYSVPDAKFEDDAAGKPVVVARATVRVKDIYNVAHVQIGTKDEKKVTLQAECGKKISEIADKEIVIRIVDNAAHSTKKTVVGNSENTCVDGDWDQTKFKVIFWYEMPLYQYASYIGDKWKDAGGIEKPLIEVAYAPMFVWKKHTLCNNLVEFFNAGDGSTSNTSKVYWYAPTCAERSEDQEYTGSTAGNTGLGNPTHVIYEKTIPVSKLFVSDDDLSNEDIMPWHYAVTSQGDGFGNPPYSKDVTNDLYGYSKDMNGGDIMAKFKYKPMDFTKGKGPLKYFVEVHDCSTKSTGGSKKGEEDKFDCSGGYFKDDKYEQGQLKYNPEVVKYVQYSSSSADVSAGAQIDPTQNPNQPALAEDYKDTPAADYDWKQNPVLTSNLNTDVDGGTEVVKNFQAWGRVEIKDTIKPNIGLKIIDTIRGSIRKVYKINDLTTLACYKDLSSGEGKNWALVDNDKHNYKIRDSAKTPRAPFSLNADSEKLWEFKDVQLLLNTSPNNGRIWEGKDFEGTFPDSMQDSLAPYGTAEDTKLEITHQDMRNDTKKSNFVTWYAHDNIDGQRVKKDSAQIKKEDWYKGLTSLDFDSDNEKTPEFPDDFISKGYSSWLIKDESYTDTSVFDQMYKNGNYFKYPDLSFNNPNRKWDGSALPNGDKEISLAYGVVDQAGNKRKLKLWMYVAPLDMKIITIEKTEKRTE
ncbi:MAG: hypothetical protein ACD_47C00411G0002 [uncultured bacterium]|nr:MAG: hypothetical protein ACD_47C00411G0002 [uncultured bacterium]